MSKHPQLRAEHLAEGVAYMTAYQRLERGWSFERACNEPTRKKRRTRTIAERKVFYQEHQAKRGRPSRGQAVAGDTSPLYIRKIRAAYCDGFIKTGVLDEGMAAKLRAYADECRAAKENSKRVPAEPKASHHSGRSESAGNNRAGSASQIDGEIAARIADFLRP